MKDPIAGWTVERFLKSDFEVFCTLDDGSVLPLTILSVVKPIEGPDRITIRVEPPYDLKSQAASRDASSLEFPECTGVPRDCPYVYCHSTLKCPRKSAKRTSE